MIIRYMLLVIASLLGVSTAIQAQTPRVQYTIEVGDPSSKIFHVALQLPVQAGGLRLLMPASTPGAIIQNHARFVARFRATGERNQTLVTYRLDKQTWQINVPKAQIVTVLYDVHINNEDKLRLTTNWLQQDGGFLIGTTVFMYSPDRLSNPVSLELKLPPNWTVVTPLRAGIKENTFLAANYRELSDSPVQFGLLHDRTVIASGKRYRLVFDTQLPPYDEKALDKRITQIADSQHRLFGDAPFEEYIVLFHWRPDLDFGGGLARRNAMVMNIGKEWMDNLPGNLSGTFAHELFHAWNFASFYPRNLGHYDYAHENYTTAAWFIEGVTNYYVYLTFARTDLIQEKIFFDILSSDITSYESSPGRGWLSLKEADFAGWINAIESINYRSAGAVIGFLLDMKIRLGTNNKSSLDDVMRALYKQSKIAGYSGYTEGDLVAAVNNVARHNFARFFDLYVNGKGPIDYNSLLSRAGLIVKITDENGKKNYSIRRQAEVTDEQDKLLKSFLIKDSP